MSVLFAVNRRSSQIRVLNPTFANGFDRDQLREQHQLSEEIAQAITNNPLGEQPDEDELDAELEGLEQENMDERMLKTGTVPVGDRINQLPTAANGERKSGSILFQTATLQTSTNSKQSKTNRSKQKRKKTRRQSWRNCVRKWLCDSIVLIPFDLPSVLVSSQRRLLLSSCGFWPLYPCSSSPSCWNQSRISSVYIGVTWFYCGCLPCVSLGLMKG